jgi:hypothetical protein
MSKIFAKTFVRNERQILFRKDFDIDDDMFTVDGTMDSEKIGGYVTVSAKYTVEIDRDKKFDEISEESELFISFFDALSKM